MSTITLRVTEDDKKMIEQFAKFDGKSISEYIRELIYEKIEDYEDRKSIIEYEKGWEKGDRKTYTHEEVWGEMNSDEKV